VVVGAKKEEQATLPGRDGDGKKPYSPVKKERRE
jgi:hypothetical protein